MSSRTVWSRIARVLLYRKTKEEEEKEEKSFYYHTSFTVSQDIHPATPPSLHHSTDKEHVSAVKEA